ncbi:MAG: hypothetical protein L0196_03650 [candidate division Zixibacteria bacterium]|nr:hypothetical protein [candidate division Zixibacteria bacterium]
MKVFILGAGASAASQANMRGFSDGQRAPLVNELFHPRYLSYFDELGFSKGQFEEFSRAKKPNDSIEQWLTERWLGITKLKTPSRIQAERTEFGKIAFYLWRLLQGVSNTYNDTNLYRSFLKKLRTIDENFGIINFNYDTLLD